ncbi:MAG TPA: secondary thiamine-phosphate synthase enzyme YjbQ [Solirubrobacteraceae bacterium]|nr:secondary thiamine-phosphate synthase enzyme YjbQ [Solirubrobacteraceae bacterium]
MHPDATQLGLASFHRTLTVDTADAECLHDLTDDVQRFVDGCNVQSGLVIAQSLHTTAGLLLNERETGLQADFREVADALVPRRRKYRHDDMTVRWENLCPEDFEAPNGHAHLQHALFGAPSITLPIADGQMVLGRWQRLILVEYDRPRRRRVHLQALGAPVPSRHLPAAEAAVVSQDVS